MKTITMTYSLKSLLEVHIRLAVPTYAKAGERCMPGGSVYAKLRDAGPYEDITITDAEVVEFVTLIQAIVASSGFKHLPKAERMTAVNTWSHLNQP